MSNNRTPACTGGAGGEVERAVALAGSWSAMVRARVDADATGDAARQRYTAAQLADVASGVPEAVVRAHANARGMPAGRHAASLVFQRTCHRVCLVAVTTSAAGGGVLDLAASGVVTEFTDGSPSVLVLTRPVARPLDAAADPTDVAAALVATVTDHLLPFGAALHEVAGLGWGNLWGDLAASFALGVRIASRHIGIPSALALGEAIAAAHPRLARGGAYRVLGHAGVQGLFYDRASCCHWYAVPTTGRYCTWCSRLSEVERTARFHTILAERAGAP